MEPLSHLNILIDFVGHPSINEDFLNTKRMDTLSTLIRYKNNNKNVIVSIGGMSSIKKEWQYYIRYYEMFLELKQIAQRKINVDWIDINYDIDIESLLSKLQEHGYLITPQRTKINIAGTNLSGCVLHNKQTSISNFARIGFKVNLILPMCAEAENSGINDLDKMMKSICIVYNYLKNNKLNDNVEFIYEPFKKIN